MSRHIFSLAETQAGGRLSGAESKKLKLGIFSLTLEQRRENSSLGGKVQGPLQGKLNVKTGQVFEALAAGEDARLAWARSEVNRQRMRKIGRQRGATVDMSKIRTTEGCKLGAERGGPAGRHARWHRLRLLFNPFCWLCQVAKAAGENWWTAVYVPKLKRLKKITSSKELASPPLTAGA
jgi:hypothetical protein